MRMKPAKPATVCVRKGNRYFDAPPNWEESRPPSDDVVRLESALAGTGALTAPPPAETAPGA